jgi:hypothetical protein
VIGRDGPVKGGGYAIIKWAREQAREQDLSPVEAHVLLLLATYSDENACAWPSIKTLTELSGRKVGVRKASQRERRGHEKQPDTPRNSAISAALQGLQDRGLIWTKRDGRRTPIRELLCPNPSPSVTQGDDAPVSSSVVTDDRIRPSSGGPDDDGRDSSSALRDAVVRSGGPELPVGTTKGTTNNNGTTKSSRPLPRTTANPRERTTANGKLHKFDPGHYIEPHCECCDPIAGDDGDCAKCGRVFA